MKNKKLLIVLIIVCVIVVAIIAGVVVLNINNNQNSIINTDDYDDDGMTRAINLGSNTLYDFYTDGENAVTVKREKSSEQVTFNDFINDQGENNDLYPGDIVKLDTSSRIAKQEIVTASEVSREHTESSKAEVTVDYSVAENEKYIEEKLGLKDSSSNYNANYKAVASGKLQQMFVVFNQKYYTVTSDVQVNSESSSDKAVVSKANFGRRVIVLVSTSNTSKDILNKWKSAITENGFDPNVFNAGNINFNVFTYGGKYGNKKSYAGYEENVNNVNEFINSELDYNPNEMSAYLLSYELNYVKDGTQVVLNKTLDNLNTTAERRGKIHVFIDDAGDYFTKHIKFYAKEIKGIDNNGNYKLGNWVCIRDADGGDQDFWISGKYGEFGFSFDITWGTDWPFSSPFWSINQGIAKDIFIDLRGEARTADITIKVNNNTVVHETNCSSHSEYKW